MALYIWVRVHLKWIHQELCLIFMTVGVKITCFQVSFSPLRLTQMIKRETKKNNILIWRIKWKGQKVPDWAVYFTVVPILTIWVVFRENMDWFQFFIQSLVSTSHWNIFSKVKIILFLFQFPYTYQQFAQKYSIYQEHHLLLSVPLGLFFAMVISFCPRPWHWSSYTWLGQSPRGCTPSLCIVPRL